MAKPTTKSPYSVHPGIQMMTRWIDELPAKTGRSLEQWFALIRKHGPKGEKLARDWLKAEHDLGTNNAAWLAEKCFGGPESLAEDTPDGYRRIAPEWVEQQYAGKKASLRPLYDRLLKLGLSMAKDVKACPCRTIVPLYREHVFAQIKPATNTRIDMGLALAKFTPESKIPKRIIDTGGKAKKDRITHRIPIERPEDIDGFVEKWLRIAYDLDI